MEITISLFGDTGFIVVFGLFGLALATAIVIKLIKIIWDTLPFL